MQPATQGIHHLGLTVKDIHEVSAFFCHQLGFDIVGKKPDYPAIFISDGTIMLTLWQAKGGEDPATFDRHRNIGLHHFALKVVNREALETLHSRLENHGGVSIEFGPEPLDQSSIMHMMCTIPGGIRVEFITAG